MSTVVATLFGAAVGSLLGFMTSVLLWRRDQRRQWFLQVSAAVAVSRELFAFLNSDALWLMTRQGRVPESELDRMLTVHSRAIEGLRTSSGLAPTDDLDAELRRAIAELSRGVHAFTYVASVRTLNGGEAMLEVEQSHDARQEALVGAEQALTAIERAIRAEVRGRGRRRGLGERREKS